MGDPTSFIRESRAKSQYSALGFGNFLGQSHCGPEVRVLAYNHHCIISLLVGGLYQIQGQTDIYTLLLASRVDSALEDDYPLLPEAPELVSPETIPERTDARLRYPRVKAGLLKGFAANHIHQGVR